MKITGKYRRFCKKFIKIESGRHVNIKYKFSGAASYEIIIISTHGERKKDRWELETCKFISALLRGGFTTLQPRVIALFAVGSCWNLLPTKKQTKKQTRLITDKNVFALSWCYYTNSSGESDAMKSVSLLKVVLFVVWFFFLKTLFLFMFFCSFSQSEEMHSLVMSAVLHILVHSYYMYFIKYKI